MTMRLVRLIYASTVMNGLTSEDIEEILSVSRMNNANNGLSGVLFFNSGYFLQCLEGERSLVNTTYNRILKDRRHSQAELLDYSEILERYFNTWAMGYVPVNQLTDDVHLQFIGSKDFRPYDMDGTSAQQTVLALRNCLTLAD